MGYIAHVVRGVWCSKLGICDAVCVLFVSSRSGIVFNPNTGSITDNSQSAKDIDLYFKFQLYIENPGHRKPVLILPNWLSKSGEQAHDRNLISAVSGIRTHNSLIDSPSCYHWAITALTVSEIFDSNLRPWKFRSRWQCHNICGNSIRSINVVSRLFALALTVSKIQSFQNFDWKFRPKSIRSGVIRGQISNSLSVVSPIFALILTVSEKFTFKNCWP